MIESVIGKVMDDLVQAMRDEHAAKSWLRVVRKLKVYSFSGSGWEFVVVAMRYKRKG